MQQRKISIPMHLHMHLHMHLRLSTKLTSPILIEHCLMEFSVPSFVKHTENVRLGNAKFRKPFSFARMLLLTKALPSYRRRAFYFMEVIDT